LPISEIAISVPTLENSAFRRIHAAEVLDSVRIADVIQFTLCHQGGMELRDDLRDDLRADSLSDVFAFAALLAASDGR
jgi:hypothetical protein